MSKKLQEIMNNAQTIQRSFTEPTSILVTDTEKILLQLRADFDTVHIPLGTSLDSLPSGVLKEALKTGKVTTMELSANNPFGLPFIIKWNPILENREVVGLLITTTSTEKVEMLRNTANNLLKTVDDLTEITEKLAEVSTGMIQRIENIAEDSEMAAKMIDEAYQVIKSVQDIANKSKILGLNASIEAARAGAFGKGFAVVADEIRHMADQSKEAAANIIRYLKNVNDTINQNHTSIQEVTHMMIDYTAMLEAFRKSFHSIDETAEQFIASTTIS